MTDTSDAIRNEIRDVVAEVLELEPGELTDETDFDDIGADSVQRLEVVIQLRRRFGVRYSLEEEAAINSVDDAVRITERGAAL